MVSQPPQSTRHTLRSVDVSEISRAEALKIAETYSNSVGSAPGRGG